MPFRLHLFGLKPLTVATPYNHDAVIRPRSSTSNDTGVPAPANLPRKPPARGQVAADALDDTPVHSPRDCKSTAGLSGASSPLNAYSPPNLTTQAHPHDSGKLQVRMKKVPLMDITQSFTCADSRRKYLVDQLCSIVESQLAGIEGEAKVAAQRLMATLADTHNEEAVSGSSTFIQLSPPDLETGALKLLSLMGPTRGSASTASVVWNAEQNLLHLSASLGFKSLLKQLLERGVDVNTHDANGCTSLQFAAMFGHIDCVKLLVFEGADVSVVDTSGRKARDIASAFHHHDIAHFLETRETIMANIDELASEENGDNHYESHSSNDNAGAVALSRRSRIRRALFRLQLPKLGSHRLIADKVRPHHGSDGSGDSGSPSSRTVFSGSGSTSPSTLCGQDFPISPTLAEFLEISEANGRHMPGATIFEALQAVAADSNRAHDARLLRGEASQELASWLQYCLDVSRKHPTSATGRPAILKLLQDVCVESKKLPTQYRIEGVQFDRRDRIAAGGETALYRGTYNGDQVVVREFFPHPKVPEEEMHSLIRREVIAQWQADDKNLLRLKGIYMGGDIPLIVLPFLGGGNAMHALEECASKNTCAQARRKLSSMFQEAVSGLKHLHHSDPPIIHGNIHPDNLLLDDNGVIRLTDFGRCRTMLEQSRSQTDLRFGGKLRYAAPELAMGSGQSRTNEASDIYSLAMTIYALASLEHPFSDIKIAHEAASTARSGKRPAKPHEMRLLDARQTEYLWPVLEKMWSQEPEHRLSVVQVEDEFRTSVSPMLQRESFRERVMSNAGARPIKRLDQPKTTNSNNKVDSQPSERRRTDSLLGRTIDSVKKIARPADRKRKQSDLVDGAPGHEKSSAAADKSTQVHLDDHVNHVGCFPPRRRCFSAPSDNTSRPCWLSPPRRARRASLTG